MNYLHQNLHLNPRTEVLSAVEYDQTALCAQHFPKRLQWLKQFVSCSVGMMTF